MPTSRRPPAAGRPVGQGARADNHFPRTFVQDDSRGEGVQTHEQLGLLWDMHCDQSQGYLHSKPVVAAEMVELLRSTRQGVILPPEPANGR